MVSALRDRRGARGLVQHGPTVERHLNGERSVVKRETLSQEVGFAGATGKSTAGPGKLSRELKHSRAGDPVEVPRQL